MCEIYSCALVASSAFSAWFNPEVNRRPVKCSRVPPEGFAHISRTINTQWAYSEDVIANGVGAKEFTLLIRTNADAKKKSNDRYTAEVC